MKRLLKLTMALAATGGGLLASGAAFAFPEPYCTTGYGTVEPITSVAIDGILQTSPAAVGGTPADEDFTLVVGQVAPGAAYPISVQGNSDGNFLNAYAVYIDWDHSGTWEAAESYYIGAITNSTGADGKTASTLINVPAGATLGTTRMRVAKKYQSTSTGTIADSPACNVATGTFGQAEDYTINVDPNAPVPPSLAMAFSPTNAPVVLGSTLTITIGNSSANANALSADFVDTLPAGLVLATPANASTTCGGSLTAADGAGTITLASGATIPIGSCTITANVSAAAAGIYVNSVASGALQTTQGNGPGASATFEATQGGTATSYTTGFEAPFTVATLNGQQGWGARAFSVTATNPANGTQAVTATALASPITSTQPLAISPTFPIGTTTHAAISANLRISQTTNGANWRFNPQDPAAGLVTTVIQFERTARKIQAIVFDSGGNGTFVDTGATFTADTYFSFKAIVDRSTGGLTLCKDGTQIYQDLTGAGTAGHNIGNLAMSQATGSGQTAGNTFFADDITVEYTNSAACDGSIAPHTVTSSVASGAGTVSPLGAQSVPDGGSIAFTLTPDSGFHLGTVGGTCAGSLAGNTYTVSNVFADCTVEANFEADAVTHTVTAVVGTGTGTITPPSAVVNDGDTTTFTVTAGSGFHIDTVTGCGGSLAGDTYTTGAITADCTVTANFAADTGAPLLTIDLSVANRITVTAAGGTSAATISGATSTGFYFQDFFASAGTVALGTTTVVGTATLSAASVPPDGTPSLFRAASGADTGLNIWSYSASTPTTFTAGEVAFAGTATWSVSPTVYAAMLTAPTTGNVYFPADDSTDIATATLLGTYNVILVGPTTHTVTAVVGTGTGTITPPSAVVNDGDTTTFTVTAGSGFHIDTVTGCGGSLAGNTYTTGAITADCTVTANFAADGGSPVASVTPSSLSYTVAAGASASNPLSIANTGTGTLTWSITEAAAMAPARPAVANKDAAATAGRGTLVASGPAPRANPQPMAVVIDEGFEDVATLLSSGGWITANHSNPLGASTWAQCGGTAIPPAFDGDPNSCALVNYNSTTGAGTISNWLLTPQVTFNAGSSVSFYTKAPGVADFPDRMEVRLCTTGDCTNFGTGATDVGDFTTLLLSINPNLVAADDPTGANGYPAAWTQFTIPSSALPTSGTGRIAFRYYVTDGGPSGSNSNIIGLDRVVVDNGGGGPGGCASPSDVPWLSASAVSGSVAGGSADTPDITVDAASLSAGSYSAHVCVATNDPAHALVDVPVSVTVTGGGTNPPSATVTPTSLSFTVREDQTGTQTLNIANAAGSDPLTFAITGQASRAARLLPYMSKDRHAHGVLRSTGTQKLRAGTSTHSAPAPWSPVGPDGSVTFQADDGSYENAIAWTDGASTQNAALWLNRYTATGALTIGTVSIEWPDAATADGDVTGKTVNLVAYYDADSDGDPSNAVRLGSNTPVTINGPDAFENYPTNFVVPGAGDVYLGFVDTFAVGGSTPPLFSAAVDQDGDPNVGWVAGMSTGDADVDVLGNNDNLGTLAGLSGGQLSGVWMVRGTTTGGGGTCAGAAVAWLSASPANGTVAGGANTDVTITADPSADGLAPGSYTAMLCVATNDPTQALIGVPVALTVTPAPVVPCSAADTIFCDGFDPAAGPFTQPVQDPSFEATTGDAGSNPNWAGSDSNAPGDTPFYSTALGQARTGTWAAWGGGWRAPGTQEWSQSVSITSGGQRWLNYWRNVTLAPNGTGTLTISVDGTPVSTTDIVANGVDADWTNVSVDLSAYADDGTHEVKFTYTTTGSEDGNCFVDDITIDEQQGSTR